MEKAQKELGKDNIQRTVEERKNDMKAEMSTETLSIHKLAKDLEACRATRREDVRKAASALDNLLDYPVLNKPELVSGIVPLLLTICLVNVYNSL